MSYRLHREGRLRAWLGRRFGGDAELGDRIWRRVLHGIGAAVLLYFVLPTNAFGPVPIRDVLLLALLAVLLLELVRYRGYVDLPTIRPHERTRVASFAYFAVALTAAVLVLPEPIAVVVVLGGAFVDPLLGELRLRGFPRGRAAAIGGTAYAAIAVAALVGLGAYSPELRLLLAGAGAAVAVSVEGPRSWLPVDDDLATILVPGIALAVLALLFA